MTAEKDNLKLEEMGYKAELKRNFSVWSVLGVGFSLTNSWFGISAALITGISSGGSLIIVYGLIITLFMSSCVGITLSELASAFPNSGGQYYWTTVLAPRKYAGFLAYLCGALSWPGAVFTSVAVTVSIAEGIVGMYALNAGTDFVIQKWMVFVTYEIANIVTFVFNCYDKILPQVGSASLYISLFSWFVITLTVLICSRGRYQTAEFVFTQFNNGTGWKSSAIAFIVGLINPNWSISCLDCATHLAEEVGSPERAVPIAIMGTVAIGFGTAFTYSVAMFFSLNNLSDILSSNTGVPIMDIFYQSLRSVPGALCLEVLVILTGFGCLVSCHTWQARLCWSFSRDRGLLGSQYWSKVNKSSGVPLNAHIVSCVWCGVLGCLYLASDTAFNAILTGCVIFQLTSYAPPTVCLLLKGRDKIEHGPFWLGKFGLFANIVSLCWTLFALVFYSLPFEMPVSAGNMNYVCVVIGVYVSYTLAYWFIRGRHQFKVHDAPHLLMASGSDDEENSNRLSKEEVKHVETVDDKPVAATN